MNFIGMMLYHNLNDLDFSPHCSKLIFHQKYRFRSQLTQTLLQEYVKYSEANILMSLNL